MAKADFTFQWQSWIVPIETWETEKAKLFVTLPYRMFTYYSCFSNAQTFITNTAIQGFDKWKTKQTTKFIEKCEEYNPIQS